MKMDAFFSTTITELQIMMSQSFPEHDEDTWLQEINKKYFEMKEMKPKLHLE